ncbi:unnamed protein product [Symbiodinium sp. KB8]|nr:unnamed protein product [Symbiodinium sp. KB8]
MSWYQYFSGDPFDAFVESMTYCPPPVPLKGHCPVGSSLFEGRCVPEPASSANWSLSAHCSDKNFVVGRAARINGLNASTSAAVGMLAVIFSSSCMERHGWAASRCLCSFWWPAARSEASTGLGFAWAGIAGVRIRVVETAIEWGFGGL